MRSKRICGGVTSTAKLFATRQHARARASTRERKHDAVHLNTRIGARTRVRRSPARRVGERRWAVRAQVVAAGQHEQLRQWATLSYQELAVEVMLFFVETSRADFAKLVDRAYATFQHPSVTPLKQLIPTCTCWSCSTVRRWPSRTALCSCWGICSTTCWSGMIGASSSARPPAIRVRRRSRRLRPRAGRYLHPVPRGPGQPGAAAADDHGHG